MLNKTVAKIISTIYKTVAESYPTNILFNPRLHRGLLLEKPLHSEILVGIRVKSP